MKRFLLMQLVDDDWVGKLTTIKGLSAALDSYDVTEYRPEIYYLHPQTGVPVPVNVGQRYVVKEDDRGHPEVIGMKLSIGSVGDEEYEEIGEVTFKD